MNGMERTPHYLRRQKPTGFPRISVAVGCSFAATDATGRQREMSYDLKAWTALAWGTGIGPCGTIVRGSGDHSTQFWAHLGRLGQEKGAVWVWFLGACHSLTALRFWGMLDAGMLNLGGSDPVANRVQDGGENVGNPGLCVLSDPPTIIVASMVGAKASYRFVDARNLGVNSWDILWRDVQRGLSVGWTQPGPLDSHTTVAAWRADVLCGWLHDWYGTVAGLKLGGLKATSGSQAWHGWLGNYKEGAILVHNSKPALQAERNSLFGGRAEAFSIGNVSGRVIALDSSAYYPAVARDREVPCRLVRSQLCTTGQLHKVRDAGFCCIALGTVRTTLPLVPKRAGDITIWPVGEWKATLCWPEIELLLSRGQQFDCERVWLYEPGKPFDRYIDALWRAREDAERLGMWGRRTAIKRLLNVLFGKFAQNGWQWIMTGEIDHERRFATWLGIDPRWDNAHNDGAIRSGGEGSDNSNAGIQTTQWRSVAGRLQFQCRQGESPESVPAITAWVYSLARVKLWKWMEVAGLENVHYVDTDSLWVNEKGYTNLSDMGHIGRGELGKLKVEAIHEWAIFHGVKYYETPHGITCAGWTEQTEARTEGGFVFWRPETPMESLRRSREPQRIMRGKSAPQPRPYRHGVVGEDGRVKPWSIGDETTSGQVERSTGERD